MDFIWAGDQDVQLVVKPIPNIMLAPEAVSRAIGSIIQLRVGCQARQRAHRTSQGSAAGRAALLLAACPSSVADVAAHCADASAAPARLQSSAIASYGLPSSSAHMLLLCLEPSWPAAREGSPAALLGKRGHLLHAGWHRAPDRQRAPAGDPEAPYGRAAHCGCCAGGACKMAAPSEQ